MTLSCIYWFFAIAGGVFVFLSFVAGEVSDFAGDATEGLEDTVESVLEGAIETITGQYVDIEIGSDEIHPSGPSPFSLRIWSMFATGFGIGGLIGNSLGLSNLLTLVPAFGTGIVMGLIVYVTLRYLFKAQGSTIISQDDYINQLAEVIVSIPGNNKPGKIAINIKLQRRHLPAISKDGDQIPVNTMVQIVGKEGGKYIVTK